MTENYAEFCFNRLPCGLCKLTNQFCPLMCNKTDITYNTSNPSTLQNISVSTEVRSESNEAMNCEIHLGPDLMSGKVFLGWDYLGNKLCVGDKVIFMQIDYRDFMVGTLMSGGAVKGTITHEKTNTGRTTSVQYYSQMIKYVREKETE